MASKLKSSQKSLLKQFISCTHAPERVALKCLSSNDWRIEQAVDNYFQAPERYMMGGPGPLVYEKPPFDRKKLDSLFAKYKEPKEDKIGLVGVQRLVTDLKVDPASIEILIFAWKCKAAAQCEFSREEFTHGMQDLCCDTLDKLCDMVPRLTQTIRTEDDFRGFYQFTFMYAKEPNKKTLDVATALIYLEIVMKERFKNFDLWKQFLDASSHKVISRDSWNLLLEFVNTIDSSMDNYDVAGDFPETGTYLP